MNVVSKKVSELFMTPNNVRRHPTSQVAELKKSFKMFGQYRPLVITAEGEILVGNGLFQAIKDEVETIDCVVLPADTSEATKKKLMLADNKVYELGANDYGAIDSIFKEMEDFNVPGFDENVLKDLYAESIDALETINQMFTVPEERKDEIRAVGEQRANNPEMMSKTQFKSDDEVRCAYSPVDEQTQQSEIGSKPKGTYVVCSHCGMKIWL